MNIVFYIVIFVIGAILGSFYAIQITRSLKNKPIIDVNSYCPNCGKKIGILEKIPIISYIILKGKCKHCNKKINKTYIILETVTPIILVLTAISLNLNVVSLETNNMISFVFITLYYTYIILTVGRDWAKKEMNQSLLAFGIIISIIYMNYLCIQKATTLVINTIYLVIIIILLLLNIINTKKRAQSSYLLDSLTMLVIMNIFTSESICILTIEATLLAIAIYVSINKLRNKRQRDNGKFSNNIRLVSVMGILNILTFLIFTNM